MATTAETRAASGVTDLFETIKGEPPVDPFQKMKFDKNDKNWQAAGQRRHMHRRHANQSLGVASVDLSGPHVGTPVPGNRTIATSQAHYFLVLSIKLAQQDEEKDDPAPVQVEQPEMQGEDGEAEVPVPEAQELPDDEPQPEVWVKPILYGALLEQKSDATRALKDLGADQVRTWRLAQDHDLPPPLRHGW